MAASNIIPARFDETKRSSARLLLRVPIVIKGTDAKGKTFSEETHTVVINRAGAKIVTSQLLAPDSRIQVSVPKLKRQCLARVVWWSEKKGEKNEAGIDFDDKSGDFWDVQFPKEDQVRGSAPPSKEQAESGSREPVPAKLPEVIREMVQSAVAGHVSQALEQLGNQMQALVERTEKETLEEFKDLMGHVIMSALERLEARIREALERNEQVERETLARLAKEAEEQWMARLAEYEARLAAGTQKARQDLAHMLAGLSDTLKK